jgi:hypothetical protein
MEQRKETTGDQKRGASTASKAAAGRKQEGDGAGNGGTQNQTQNANAQNPGGQQSGGNPGGQTQGGNPGGQTQGGNEDLLQHAKKATGEIVNQVQQQAGSQISRQKETAASELTNVVNAVRKFGESLSQEQTGALGRYAAEYGNKAADNLERFSTYIRQQDPKQLLNDVQNFGRRRPALLLGGAFLLGFAGARLIKSSMEAGAWSSTQGGTGRQRSSNRQVSAGPNVHTPNVPATRQSATPNTV